MPSEIRARSNEPLRASIRAVFVFDRPNTRFGKYIHAYIIASQLVFPYYFRGVVWRFVV